MISEWSILAIQMGIADMRRGCRLRSLLLSSRETQVLRLVAEGESNRAIGETLDISVRTMEAHRSHVMSKLNLASVTELVRYAVRNGLVDP